MGLGKAAAKALVWTSLESFALSGLSLISLVVFARLLSAEHFGVVAISLAIVQVLTVPVELLFHDALIQRPDVQPVHVNSAFTTSVALGTAFCAACWLLGGPIGQLIGEPELPGVLRWMSLSLIGSGFGGVLVAMQRKKLEFRSLALRSMVGRASSAVVAITLAALGAGMWSLVVQQVLLVCLATLILWWLAEERPRFQFSWAPTRELLRFGVFAMSYQLLVIFIPRVYMVLVGAYLGTESAGLLSLAFRGVDMLRDLLVGAVFHVAMPVFARLRDHRDALFDAFNRSVQLTALVTYPLFVGLATCASEVVHLAFGPQWAAAVPYFAVVALLALEVFTRMYSLPLMQTMGSPEAPNVMLLVQVVHIVVGMLLFGRYSTTHAVALLAMRPLFNVPLDMWVQRRATGMGFRRQLRGLGLPSIGVALMACAVLLVRSALPTSWPPALRLLPMVLTGGLSYVSFILLINRTVVNEFRTFLGKSEQGLDRE